MDFRGAFTMLQFSTCIDVHHLARFIFPGDIGDFRNIPIPPSSMMCSRKRGDRDEEQRN
jgi:hypothetical protein